MTDNAPGHDKGSRRAPANHADSVGDTDDLDAATAATADFELFELLDRYMLLLHSQNQSACAAFLAEHPRLVHLLVCLNSLDSLASAVRPEGSGRADAAEPTASTSAAATPAEPQAFGKYQLLREIGRGGMGVVYLARQTDLDRAVAVKMVLASRFASDDEIKRFYVEARAAGRLRHPNVVGIHEVGELHGQHFFAMDYVEGTSLAQRVRKNEMDCEEAARLMIPVARAVAYLHQHGVVHRDLKPSNILLDADGQPHLTDFGLAKIFGGDSTQTQTGTIIGTPCYMAPEQAAGRTADVSHLSDVYSLGAILYELLTGRPPFLRDSPLDTLVEVLEGEPIRPSRLNKRVGRTLELICLRCLAKDPQARYQSADELADDLEHFVRNEEVSVRPENFLQLLRRWSRRQPALVWRLVGIGTTAAIVQFRYNLVATDSSQLDYHIQVMLNLAVWIVAGIVFQLGMLREKLAPLIRYAWVATDVIVFTRMLYFVDEPLGPLLIGYPLIIAATGLFFRPRLVLFGTVVAMFAYTALAYSRGGETAIPVQYHVIFALAIIVTGFVVQHQVQRVVMLSRYYEHRRIT